MSTTKDQSPTGGLNQADNGVSRAIEAARPAIERISNEVWDLAEISLHEVKSAQVHIRELKDTVGEFP